MNGQKKAKNKKTKQNKTEWAKTELRFEKGIH